MIWGHPYFRKPPFVLASPFVVKTKGVPRLSLLRVLSFRCGPCCAQNCAIEKNSNCCLLILGLLTYLVDLGHSCHPSWASVSTNHYDEMGNGPWVFLTARFTHLTRDARQHFLSFMSLRGSCTIAHRKRRVVLFFFKKLI